MQILVWIFNDFFVEELKSLAMVAQSISSEQSHGCTHCQNGGNFSEHKDNNVGTRRNRTFRDDMGEQ